MNLEHIRSVGQDLEVPLLDGTYRRYINFDNAASTPVLEPVWQGVQKFMQWYSSIHRGAGFKSQLSTWAYEKSREVLCDFLGADASERVVIFGRHTTDAINKLANRYPFQQGDVLITTIMEHHANDLPWRGKAEIVRIKSDEKSPIRPEVLEQALKENQGRCKLVAITGASNVTGLINPIYELAKVTHRYGAEIMVDAAQLAPHRQIHMGRRGDEEAIDYLVLSAHKMYAPFGAGAIVGWPDIFELGAPDYVGGGAVKFVAEDEVLWKEPPDKEEAGSPNVVGVVALSLAANTLQKIGMEAVAEHEARLAARLLDGLTAIPEIELVGPHFYDKNLRVGVIVFNLKGMHHSKTAAILSCEFGIAVRNGCFCAHPYLKYLLKYSEEEARNLREKIRNNEDVELPGAVRASFGIYNTLDEVDYFLEAIAKIARGDYSGEYIKDPEHGDYWPRGFDIDFRDFFNFVV
ncbi:MAG: aminotransferase class V-fold PLP-dependent enzyme [candidate division KSB1 bacterium]|nr:aminotransferase class V-fold PLP-dependent enzyme [candidate division KSB1 bacterium]